MAYDELTTIAPGEICEVFTNEEMTAALVAKNVGKIYRFMGTTGTYINGDLYEVKYRRLPTEYTELEYIQANCTQYIDTNFIPTGNSKINIVFKSNNVANDGCYIYGSGIDYATTAFECYPWTSDGVQKWQVNYGNNGAQYLSQAKANIKTEIICDKGAVTITDEEGQSITGVVSQQSFTTPYNLYLLALHRANTYISSGQVNIYSCKLYENGILVREFIPVKREIDSAIGLFDLVNSIWYGNAGTGSFIAGPIIE